MQSTMDRIKELLMALYEPQDAFEWLFRPQPMFDHFSPMQMIEGGRGGDVLAALERVDQGAYS